MTSNPGPSIIYATIPIHPGQEIPDNAIAHGTRADAIGKAYEPAAHEVTRLHAAMDAIERYADDLDKRADDFDLEREANETQIRKLCDSAARLAIKFGRY